MSLLIDQYRANVPASGPGKLSPGSGHGGIALHNYHNWTAAASFQLAY
jgi:hypothetical protein